MRGAVTGVFSYSGRFIAEALLARGWEVVALGRRRPPPADSLAERVDFYPLLLDDEESLVTALSGCEALFNTYWVRFEHGGATFAEAIERSSRLFRAASGARVRRIVHLSVSNASADSPFPYFRGKAAVEDALRRGDCRYAILRPTLIFGGREEVLVNNIAWLLRRLPLFLVPDGGRCRLQPVSVFDLHASRPSSARPTATAHSILPALRPSPSPTSWPRSKTPSAVTPASVPRRAVSSRPARHSPVSFFATGYSRATN